MAAAAAATCVFYNKGKQRRCQFAALPPDYKFCTVHHPGKSDEERIACPVDPAHTIYRSKLLSHIHSCTKTRDIAWELCQPFVCEDVNHTPEWEVSPVPPTTHLTSVESEVSPPPQTIQQLLDLSFTFPVFEEQNLRHGPQCCRRKAAQSPSEFQDTETLKSVYATVEKVYERCCTVLGLDCDKLLQGLLPEETRSDDSASLDLALDKQYRSNSFFRNVIRDAVGLASEQRQQNSTVRDNNDGASAPGCVLLLDGFAMNKHDAQNAALLATALEHGYLTPAHHHVICVEFGAGRGALSRYFILATSDLKRSSKFILIDREKRRNRAEGKGTELFLDRDRATTSIFRIRCDVRDFDLGAALRFILGHEPSALFAPLPTTAPPPRILRFLRLFDTRRTTVPPGGTWREVLERLAAGGGIPIHTLVSQVRDHLGGNWLVTANGVDDAACQPKDVQLLCLAKHLCGGGIDAALRCIVNGIQTLRERFGATQHQECRCPPEKKRVRDEQKTHYRFKLTVCLILAPCCHHRCSWSSTLGKEFLQQQGVSAADLEMYASISGWGTGAAAEKQRLGIHIKRIIDLARVAWLRTKGFSNATLTTFIQGQSVTIENVALLGSQDVFL